MLCGYFAVRGFEYLTCSKAITIGITATAFPPLRGSKPARVPGVMAQKQGVKIEQSSNLQFS